MTRNDDISLLYCSNNRLSSLDVSALSKLNALECSNNNLISLDISKNKYLQVLFCEDNYIEDTTKLEAAGRDEHARVKKDAEKWQRVGWTIQPQKEPIKVKSVKTQPALTLAKGRAVVLPAAVQPSYATDTKVTWRSKNPKIATVDKTTGKVKALKTGRTVIVATSADGKKKSLCRVTVIAKSINIKAIAVIKPISLKVGKTALVKPRAIPAKASSVVYKYSSSKKSVVTIDKAGVITAHKKGTAVITVKAGTKTRKFVVAVRAALPVKTVLDKTSVFL
jgi:hypothetical protein